VSGAGVKSRYFALDRYLLRQGTQLPRLHEYLQAAYLPAVMAAGVQTAIVLEGLITSHVPQVTVLTGFGSLEEIADVQAALGANPHFDAAARWQEGGEPFERQERILLETADYSPPITIAEASPAARVFELRVYRSGSAHQFRALHERFAGPEIGIFHRLGIHPILYASTLFGPDVPTLVYLTPFENLAAREKAWDAFREDPEWIRVRKESVEQHGQINSYMQIQLYRSAGYSPVR